MKKITFLILISTITLSSFGQISEETAVKNIIEKETQSFLDRNTAAMVTYHANVPYALTLVYHGEMEYQNGIAYSTNKASDMPARTVKFLEQMGKSDGTRFENSNYTIHINGNSAFVHYDQILIDGARKKSYKHEVRYLEKISNDWKIVYVGYVDFTASQK